MGQNVSSAVMQQRSEPHDIVTIAEARTRGLRWYFSGQPCAHGHLAKRNVSNRECRQCVDARRAANRRGDPEPARAKDRARHERTIVARRQQSRESRARHVERRRAEDRDRYHRNPAPNKARAVQWSRANKGKRAAIIAARRMAQKRATPAWLTEDQKAEIGSFYIEAARREGEWHVDHIIPINGRLVCGLHVPWNLQLLTGDENRRKGNSHAE